MSEDGDDVAEPYDIENPRSAVWAFQRVGHLVAAGG